MAPWKQIVGKPLEDLILNRGGLIGNYYDLVTENNRAEGVLGDYKFSRVDGPLIFNWGSGSPDTRIGADTFGVVWKGKIAVESPNATNPVNFYVSSDRGSALTITDPTQFPLINTKNLGFNNARQTLGSSYLPPNNSSSDLSQGIYDIQATYFSTTGNAYAELYWQPPGQSSVSTIPAAQLLYGREAVPSSGRSFASLAFDAKSNLLVADGTLKYYFFDLAYYNRSDGSQATSLVESTSSKNPFSNLNLTGQQVSPAFFLNSKYGQEDLVVGTNSGIQYYVSRNSYYENWTNLANPFGNLTEAISQGGGAPAPTFGDLDGDGDRDLVVGDRYGNLRYYRDQGVSDVLFTPITGTANPFNGIDIGGSGTTEDLAKPVLIDWDNDQDLDLVVGRKDGTLLYFKNTGSTTNPVFTQQTGTANPFDGIDVGDASAPAVVDYDRDVDLDLFVGNQAGEIKVFQNTTIVPLTLSVDNPVVVEGDPGTNKTVNWTVRLSKPLASSFTVNTFLSLYANIRTEEVSGLTFDNNRQSYVNLTFNPGETEKTIPITIVGDNVYEGDEYVSLRVYNSSLSLKNFQPQGILTIQDNDPIPKVSISDVSVFEGDFPGSKNATLNLSLDRPAEGQNIRVNYNTSDGTAIAGTDYTSIYGTEVFQDLQTTRTVNVSLIGDKVPEANKTFNFNLLPNHPDTTIPVAVSQGVVTIVDDEPILKINAVKNPSENLNGLYVEYFDDANLTNRKLISTDSTLDLTTSKISNTSGVRWLAKIAPQTTGEYTFYSKANNGVRLWVDGQLLVDQWNNTTTNEYSNKIALEAGQLYDVRMEYKQNAGTPLAQLLWSGPDINKQIVPNNVLYAFDADGNPANVGWIDLGLNAPVQADRGLRVGYRLPTNGTALEGYDYISSKYQLVSTDPNTRFNGIIIPKGETTGRIYLTAKRDPVVEGTKNFDVELFSATQDTGLVAEYFKDINFSQPAPIQGRIDQTIDLDWGSGKPIPELDVDNFSVRWTGKIRPLQSGEYTFFLNVNDGAKLTINNQVVIDKLSNRTSSPQEFSGKINLSGNTAADIKIEYAEATGNAKVQLLWQGPGITAKQIVPQSVLSPSYVDYGFRNSAGQLVDTLTQKVTITDDDAYKTGFVLLDINDQLISAQNPLYAGTGSAQVKVKLTSQDAVYLTFSYPGFEKTIYLNNDSLNSPEILTLTGINGNIPLQVKGTISNKPIYDRTITIPVTFDRPLQVKEGEIPVNIPREVIPSVVSLGDVEEDGGRVLQFLVRLNQPAPEGGSAVHYRLEGSAIAGIDYIAPTVSTITVEAGQTSAILGVEVLNDAITENPETLTVTLEGLTGLTGNYYNNFNDLLNRQVKFVRNARQIDFNWLNDNPDPSLPEKGYQVEWKGNIIVPTTGEYSFYIPTKGVTSLAINGNIIAQTPYDNLVAQELTTKINLQAGKVYSISLLYTDNVGDAGIQLLWSGPGISKQLVSDAYLYPTVQGLRADYFNQSYLTEGSIPANVTPTLTRLDSNVDFVWGTGSPDARLNSDNFSVRWTGQISSPVPSISDFYYKFYVTSNEGVRLWIDEKLAIDQWNNQGTKEFSSAILKIPGAYKDKANFRLEYLDQSGAANVQLFWEEYGTDPNNKTPISSKSLVPTTVFVPAAGTGSTASLQLLDNDKPGVEFVSVVASTDPTTNTATVTYGNSLTQLTTSESGTTDQFAARLQTQPTADVTINFAEIDGKEGKFSVNSLTFTPQNWNQYQTVTVTGLADSIKDADIRYTVKTTTSTTDPTYQNRPYQFDVVNQSINALPETPYTPTTEDPNTPNASIRILNPINSTSQYASKVIAKSSEYSSNGWSAMQALGTPNTLSYGDINTAWTSKNPNGTTEFLTLGFDTPVYADGVTIRETYGNGFITKVEVLDLTGQYTVVWQGQDPSAKGSPVDFRVDFPKTNFLVNGVRLTVDTNASSSYEEIDAVQLHGSTGDLAENSSTTKDFEITLDKPAGANGVTVYLDTNGSTASIKDYSWSAAPTLVSQTQTILNPTTGQNQTIKLFTNPLEGVDVGSLSNPVFADLDGDGDLDLIVGDDKGTLNYFQNQGSANLPLFTLISEYGSNNPFGAFNAAQNITVNNTTTKRDVYLVPNFYDLDKDGDLDAVVAVKGGQLRYVQNIGTATQPLFGAAIANTSTNPFNGIVAPTNYAVPALGDLNGDGKVELLLGHFNGINVYSRNANGTFSQLTGTSNPLNNLTFGNSTKPVLLDWDRDGDLDLFTGLFDGTVGYFQNTGTATNPKFIAATSPFGGFQFNNDSMPALGDIDNDGDFDALVGNGAGTLSYLQGMAAVTIAPGQTSAKVTVTPLDDKFVEGDETLQVNLTRLGAYRLGNDPTTQSASLTISSDDIPGVTFSKTTNLTTAEGGSPLDMTVRLNSQPVAPVRVYLGSNDRTEGLFKVGTDPAQEVVSLFFTPDNWNQPQNFQIVPVNDAIADGAVAYKLIATFESPDLDYQLLKPDPVTITNNDDSDKASVSLVVEASAVEGRANLLNVRLSSQPTAEVTVVLTPQDDQITIGGDRITAPHRVTFNPNNWDIPQQIAVLPVDDDRYELLTQSQIKVSLETTDAKYYNLNGTINPVTVQVLDNDLPTVAIAPGMSASELFATPGYFRIYSNAPLDPNNTGIKVNYKVLGGTATEDSDYLNTTKNYDLRIAGGETETNLVIQPIDDKVTDRLDTTKETVTIELLPGQGYVLRPNQTTATITIQDDDKPGVQILEAGEYTQLYEGGSGQFLVSLLSQPLAPVNINLNSTTQKQGKDQLGFGLDLANPTTTKTLTFTPENWYLTQSVDIQGLDDGILEQDVYNTAQIAYQVSSTDPTYNNFAIPTQTLRLRDRLIDPEAAAAAFREVIDIFSNAVAQFQPPLIGQSLIPDSVFDPFEEIAQEISTEDILTSVQLEKIIEKGLSGFKIGDATIDVTVDMSDTDVLFQFGIADTFDYPIDVSFDALSDSVGIGLEAQGKIVPAVSYNFNLGIGFFTDAFTAKLRNSASSLDVIGGLSSVLDSVYIDTEKTEFEVRANVSLSNDFKLKGSLGFISADLANNPDNPTKIDFRAKVRLNDVDNRPGIAFIDSNENGILESKTVDDILAAGELYVMKDANGNVTLPVFDPNNPLHKELDANNNGKFDLNDVIYHEGVYRGRVTYLPNNQKQYGYYFDSDRDGVRGTDEPLKTTITTFDQTGTLLLVGKDSPTATTEFLYIDNNENKIFDAGDTKVEESAGKLATPFTLKEDKTTTPNKPFKYYDGNNNGKYDLPTATYKDDIKISKSVNPDNDLKLTSDEFFEPEGELIKGAGFAYLDANNNNILDAGEKFVNGNFGDFNINENSLTFLDLNNDGLFNKSSFIASTEPLIITIDDTARNKDGDFYKFLDLNRNGIRDNNEPSADLGDSEGTYESGSDPSNKTDYYFFDANRDGLLTAGEPFTVNPNEFDKPFILSKANDTIYHDRNRNNQYDEGEEVTEDINSNEDLTLTPEPVLTISDTLTYLDLAGNGSQDSNDPKILTVNGVKYLDLNLNNQRDSFEPLSVNGKIEITESSDTILDLDNKGIFSQSSNTKVYRVLPIKDNSGDRFLDVNGNGKRDPGEAWAKTANDPLLFPQAAIIKKVVIPGTNGQPNKEIFNNNGIFIDLNGNNTLDQEDPLIRITSYGGRSVRYIDLDNDQTFDELDTRLEKYKEIAESDGASVILEPWSDPNNTFNESLLLQGAPAGSKVVRYLDDYVNRLSLSEIYRYFQDTKTGSTTIPEDSILKWEVAGGINIGLDTKTSFVGNSNLPSLGVDINGYIPLFYKGNLEDNPSGPGFDLSFDNIQLDAGNYLSKGLRTVFNGIKPVINVLRPVVDVLNKDTKLFSTLNLANQFDYDGDKKVTMLELGRQIAILQGRNDWKTRIETAIKWSGYLQKTISVIDAVNALPDNQPLILDMGSYTLDDIRTALAPTPKPTTPNDPIDPTKNPTEHLASTRTPSDPKVQAQNAGNPAQANFMTRLKSLDNFDLAILNPDNLIGALMGKKDVDLVTWDFPDFDFEFGLEKNYPIYGPLSVGFKGNVKAKTDLAFGVDTYGYYKAQETGDYSYLLDSIYVKDWDNSGFDKPEFSLNGSISASASLSAVVARASLEGGIKGTLGLDLEDTGERNGTSDGKVRLYSDVVGNIANLVEVYGSLDAFVKAKLEVGIDFGFWSVMEEVWSAELAKINLFKFTLNGDGFKSSTGFSGKAVDGFIVGGQVFLDANFNGILDAGEPVTVTNRNGQFKLEVPDATFQQFDTNQDGSIDLKEGRLAMIGGIDSGSELPFEGILTATVGSPTITPFTSLVERLARLQLANNTSGGDPAQVAKETILSKWYVAGSRDFLKIQPYVLEWAMPGEDPQLTPINPATTLITDPGVIFKDEGYALLHPPYIDQNPDTGLYESVQYPQNIDEESKTYLIGAQVQLISEQLAAFTGKPINEIIDKIATRFLQSQYKIDLNRIGDIVNDLAPDLPENIKIAASLAMDGAVNALTEEALDYGFVSKTYNIHDKIFLVNAKMHSVAQELQDLLGQINRNELQITVEDFNKNFSTDALLARFNNSPYTASNIFTPQTADFSRTIVEDTTYTFGVSDFPFVKGDPDDTLKSVIIETEPLLGTLKLGSQEITGDTEVAVADIQAGLLTYTPYNDGSGTPYDRFTFRVTDGKFFSDDPHNITINVTDYNPGVLAFSNPDFSIKEDGTPVVAVEINRTEGADGEVTATLDLTDGTAKSGSDYNNTPLEIKFADGEINKRAVIPIIDDTVAELDETILLAIASTTGGATIGSQNTAVVTIVDNEPQRTGGSGNDILTGSGANERISGLSGQDVLSGGGGDDLLIGGADKDILMGGSGNDQFFYQSFDDREDVITDFNLGNDTIVLTELFDKLGYTGTNPIADGYMRLVETGFVARVQIDTDGLGSNAVFKNLTTLTNVSLAPLDINTDFVF